MTRSVHVIMPYPGIGLVGARASIMQIILVRRRPTSEQGAHHLDTSHQSDSKANIEEPVHPMCWLLSRRALLSPCRSLTHERRSAYRGRTLLPRDSHNGTRQRFFDRSMISSRTAWHACIIQIVVIFVVGFLDSAAERCPPPKLSWLILSDSPTMVGSSRPFRGHS